MRIIAMKIAGFRAFTREQSLDLDSDFILLAGQNGAGKTSFMDAILWTLTGHIPRLASATLRPGEDYISNRYSESIPRVSLTLEDAEGSYTVERSGFGKDVSVTAELPTGETLEGDEAEAWLADNFNPPGFGGKGFERSFILQQDAIREFLVADPKDRYRFLSYLAGVDDTETLDRRVRAELKKLKEAEREVAAQLEGEESRLGALEKRHGESSVILSRISSDETERSQAISRRLARLLEVEADNVGLESLVQSGTNEVSQLSRTIDEFRRRSAALESARRTVADSDFDEAAIDQLRVDVLAAEANLRRAEEQAQFAETAAREASHRQDRQRQLATLALDQLGERCPVCDQTYDRDHAVSHLRTVLGGDASVTEPLTKADLLRGEATEATQYLTEIRQRLSAYEREEASFRAASQLVQVEVDATTSLNAQLEAISQQKGMEAGEFLLQLQDAVQSAQGIFTSLRQGDVVNRQVGELEVGITSQRRFVSELTTRRDLLVARVHTGEAICDWLGKRLVSATTKVVKAAIPLINELYARLDIHPTFRRFDFSSEHFYQAGRVQPWLFDDESEIDGNAGYLLSSAQLNVLAICLFLAMNLSQKWSPLDVVVFDDPIQSMDDVHLLGLADALRGIRGRRQIIVSTHDPRATELLWRKLRPPTSNARNMRIEFNEWTSSDGPSFKAEVRDLESVGIGHQLLSSKALLARG